MPNYDFACQHCGHAFVVRRRFGEMDDPAPCPKCQSKQTQRQISLFYATNTGTSTAAASSPKTRVRHF